MLQLLAALKDNNYSYVANNMRFVEFTHEEFYLALLVSPTPELTKVLIAGVRMKEETPCVALLRAALKGEFSTVAQILADNKVNISLLELVLAQVNEVTTKKMIQFAINKNKESV